MSPRLEICKGHVLLSGSPGGYATDVVHLAAAWPGDVTGGGAPILVSGRGINRQEA